MDQFIWEPSVGEAINITYPNYMIVRAEGLSEILADIQTQKAPFQDGETLLDQLMDTRFIQLRVAVTNSPAGLQGVRRDLIKAFNPKLGEGKLTWNPDAGGEYMINAVPESTPSFPDLRPGKVTALLRLSCSNPYWKDEETLVTYSDGANITLNNYGDVQTPLRILFEGPATGPKLTNVTTGEHIGLQADYEIVDGDEVYISTAFGQKEVRLIKADNSTENIFHKLDPESIMFWLLRGENELVFDLQAGTGEAHVKFQRQYAGV